MMKTEGKSYLSLMNEISFELYSLNQPYIINLELADKILKLYHTDPAQIEEHILENLEYENELIEKYSKAFRRIIRAIEKTLRGYDKHTPTNIINNLLRPHDDLIERKHIEIKKISDKRKELNSSREALGHRPSINPNEGEILEKEYDKYDKLYKHLRNDLHKAYDNRRKSENSLSYLMDLDLEATLKKIEKFRFYLFTIGYFNILIDDDVEEEDESNTNEKDIVNQTPEPEPEPEPETKTELEPETETKTELELETGTQTEPTLMKVKDSSGFLKKNYNLDLLFKYMKKSKVFETSDKTTLELQLEQNSELPIKLLPRKITYFYTFIYQLAEGKYHIINQDKKDEWILSMLKQTNLKRSNYDRRKKSFGNKRKIINYNSNLDKTLKKIIKKHKNTI